MRSFKKRAGIPTHPLVGWGNGTCNLPVSLLAAFWGSYRDLELSPTGELGAVAALDRSEGLPPAGAEVLSRESTPPGGNRLGSYWDWARL